MDGQSWSNDPWTLTERDGQLHGRGACDMKGFDALAIEALVRAKEAPLQRPLQIALSYDEEIGCAIAAPLVQAMAKVLPKAAIAIVGEPSMMKVVTGHKGNDGYRVHVKGYEMHSSLMHRGVNAIMEGARLIDWANRTNARLGSLDPNPVAAAFEPPWTTVHVGTISGGTAANITAKDCRFSLDFRFVPSDDPDALKAEFIEEVAAIQSEMQNVHTDTGIEVVPHFGVPALKPETNGAAEELTRKLTGDNGTHVVSYATEAGHFQNAGYSTVVCGPGNIAQAHQPDEFITLQQLAACEDFLKRVVHHLCQ